MPLPRDCPLGKKSCDRGLRGQIVIHSSGALSAGVLREAAKAGASVGSVHPLMSFPTRRPVTLKGVSFAVEAAAASSRVLNHLIRCIGGRPFAIKAADKALYHAVGVLSSPLLVSHLAAAHETAARAGFSPRQARRLIEPIARATLDNFFRRGPPGAQRADCQGRCGDNSSASSGTQAPSYLGERLSLPRPLCAGGFAQPGQGSAPRIVTAKIMRNLSRQGASQWRWTSEDRVLSHRNAARSKPFVSRFCR